jgi:hypothetical protein
LAWEKLEAIKVIKQRYQFLLFVVAWLICNEVLSPSVSIARHSGKFGGMD